MNKTKGYIAGIWICAIMLVVLLVFSFLPSNLDSDFTISNFDMEIVFDEQGNMHVKEKVTNTYNTEHTVFYKNIEYHKNNSFSTAFDESSIVKDVRLTVESNNRVVFDSETSENTYGNFVGYSYKYDVDERGDLITCGYNCAQIFYYDSSGIDEVTTFTYEYTINGVVTQYADISEINWVFLDIQSMPVKNVTIEVTLPDGNYDLRNEETFFHGSSKGKVEFIDNNKILITADKLMEYEMIESRLLVDNSVFTGVNQNNIYNVNRLEDILAFEEEQINEGNFIAFLSVYGVYGGFVLFIIVLLVLAIFAYKKLDKEYVSDFYNEYYRELPAEYEPAIMGCLYKFEDIDDKDLTATLLDLIRRKYLILDTNNCGVNDEDPNYLIKLDENKNLDDLQEQEKFVIDWFIKDIGDGKKVSAKEINSYCDDYDSAMEYNNKYNKWIKLVRKDAKKYNFFEKGTKSKKSKFLSAGLIAFILFGLSILLILWYIGLLASGNRRLILGCLFAVFGIYACYINSINKRSRSGNEDYVRWKAFKKFLEEFSTFEDYPIPSLIIWEHYLVYATSFGIADKVTKQLKLKVDVTKMESVDTTFVMYYGLRFNHIGRINNNIGNLRSRAMNTISRNNTTRGAGGSPFGGGGFSGGSSFGGGGGSFGGR